MKLQINLLSPGTKPKIKRSPFSDLSIFVLIFTNIVIMIIAIKEDWNILQLLWIYLAQNYIIGVFSFIRILSLKKFKTNGLLISGKAVNRTKKTKYQIAFFFLFHYGFFHVIYTVLLFVISAGLIDGSLTIYELIPIFVGAGVFFLNHLFSFVYNYSRDINSNKNIGSMMFTPYLRVLPMHLLPLVIGLFLGNALLTFLVLKTVVDVIMHYIEHR
jgi:hypothetical protein